MKHLFLLFLFPLILFGQDQAKIDSLNVLLENADHDTTRAKLLIELGKQYRNGNLELAMEKYEQALSIARKAGSKKWEARSLNGIGILYKRQGNFKVALDYFSKSLKIREEIGHKKAIAVSLANIGVIYYNQGNFKVALDYYSKSLKIKEELGNKRGIASSLSQIAIIYKDQGNFKVALDYYSKSLKIYEELGNKRGIAESIFYIGLVYQNQGNFKMALDYYSKSLKIREELGDKRDIAISLNNIGMIYEGQGKYEQAFDNYIKSLKIREELGDKRGIAFSLKNIGAINKLQGNYEEAMEHYSKSLKIHEEVGYKQGVSNSLSHIGNLYLLQNKTEKAITFVKKGLAVAQEIGVVTLERNSSKLLYNAYKKIGQSAKALEMYELYIEMRDSVNRIENKEAGIKLQYRQKAVADSIKNAEADKVREAELTAEKAENLRQKQQSYFLYGGLALTLLFAVFILNRLQLTRRQKKVIEEQKLEVEEQKKDIMSNITYAKKIQDAMLPSEDSMQNVLPDSFTLYLPKDVVSGDFYWVYKDKKGVAYFTVGDCTGHGVSGAFMSIVGQTLLNELVVNKGMTEVNAILMQMREYIIHYLHQKGEAGEARDGMDMALCRMDKSKNKLSYAGAHNSLYLMRGGELIEYKGSMRPVGYYLGKGIPFEKEEIEIKKGDVIYLFTDGYADQFGGPKGKKFMYGKFKKLLLSIHEKEMAEQKRILDDTLKDWMKGYEQIDDICIMGVRV